MSKYIAVVIHNTTPHIGHNHNGTIENIKSVDNSIDVLCIIIN